MALPSLLMMLIAVAMATGAHSASEENELDHGNWNYREGADSVDVASVPSVTRVLDTWGKRIFSDIKTLLNSQPSTVLPDYSRVRHLSESLNDLFREVSLLRMRITELSHRLSTVEPLLRHYGYGEKEEAAGGGRAQGVRGEVTNLSRFYRPRTTGSPGSPREGRVVRRRGMRVGGVRLEREGQNQ